MQLPTYNLGLLILKAQCFSVKSTTQYVCICVKYEVKREVFNAASSLFVAATILLLWALAGEVPRHRRADRPSWDGPTSAVAPGPPRLYVSRLVCRGMRPVSVGLAT